MSNILNKQELISSWIYNGKCIEDAEIPEKAIGFLYRINHLDGRYYIGRKLLTKAATKTVNGKKKKIRKESDWANYWSSSPMLLELIAAEGKDKFEREILLFVTTKAAMVYAEEFSLFTSGALFDPKCFNGNIRSRIQRAWFNKTPDLHSQLQKINLPFLQKNSNQE